MLKLRIQDDEGQRSEVPVQVDEITIGRDDANTICLPERNVSRRHVRLVRENGHVVLEDAGSSYGTTVNGSRIDARAILREGDNFRVGDYQIELVDDARAAEPPMPELAGRQSHVPERERSRMVVISTSLGGAALVLDRTPLSIGRSDTADLTIDHRSVSAMHASVAWTEADGYVIEDLGSANGVRVNDENYRKVTLRGGDIVELGHVKLRFVAPGDPFVYTPGMGGGEDEVLPSRSGKKALLALVGVLAAAAVTWLLVFNTPDEAERVTEPDPSGASVATREPLGEQQPPTSDEQVAGLATQEPGVAEPVEKPSPPVEIQGTTPEEWLTNARERVSEKEWASAIPLFEKVLETQPDSDEAKAGLEQAKVELGREQSVEHVVKLVEDRNYRAAWKAVQELSESTSSNSVYHDRIGALVSEVKPAYVNDSLDRAETFIEQKSYKVAGDMVADALSVDKGNARALKMQRAVEKKVQEVAATTKKETAAKQEAAAKAAKAELAAQQKAEAATNETVAAKTASAKELAAKEKAAKEKAAKEKAAKEKAAKEKAAKEPEKAAVKSGSNDAKRLYHEGRTAKIQGNLGLAVDRFQAAAKAGFADAHKQLGVIYASQGKAQQAVRHYKEYLGRRPNAADAAAVRTAIERLGGSL